jgi:hypothetical protein
MVEGLLEHLVGPARAFLLPEIVSTEQSLLTGRR